MLRWQRAQWWMAVSHWQPFCWKNNRGSWAEYCNTLLFICTHAHFTVCTYLFLVSNTSEILALLSLSQTIFERKREGNNLKWTQHFQWLCLLSLIVTHCHIILSLLSCLLRPFYPCLWPLQILPFAAALCNLTLLNFILYHVITSESQVLIWAPCQCHS